jgi:membrane associated rhomboid family serine protease
LFIVSGIIANLISFMFYPASLGASGAIMALIGVAAVLKPMMVVWAFSLPMPMFVLAMLWVAGSVMGIFGFGDQGTGHIAHLSGIFIGLIYGLYLRLRKKRHIENAGFVFQKKIVLPEHDIRNWEDWNLK